MQYKKSITNLKAIITYRYVFTEKWLFPKYKQFILYLNERGVHKEVIQNK